MALFDGLVSLGDGANFLVHMIVIIPQLVHDCKRHVTRGLISGIGMLLPIDQGPTQQILMYHRPADGFNKMMEYVTPTRAANSAPHSHPHPNHNHFVDNMRGLNINDTSDHGNVRHDNVPPPCRFVYTQTRTVAEQAPPATATAKQAVAPTFVAHARPETALPHRLVSPHPMAQTRKMLSPLNGTHTWLDA